MTNIADHDQVAFSEANLSGSTVFAKAGHIRVQQPRVKDGNFIHTLFKRGQFPVSKEDNLNKMSRFIFRNKRTMMVLYRSPDQTDLHIYCLSFSQVHCSRIFV